MNERLIELAKQAGGNPNYKAFRGHFLPPPPDYIDPATVDLEKFAELIVRECTNVALEQKKQVEEMEVYNLQDEVWNRARIQQSEHIVDKIKEHFGVE